jgi:hypothetical protein
MTPELSASVNNASSEIAAPPNAASRLRLGRERWFVALHANKIPDVTPMTTVIGKLTIAIHAMITGNRTRVSRASRHVNDAFHH